MKKQKNDMSKFFEKARNSESFMSKEELRSFLTQIDNNTSQEGILKKFKGKSKMTAIGFSIFAAGALGLFMINDDSQDITQTLPNDQTQIRVEANDIPKAEAPVLIAENKTEEDKSTKPKTKVVEKTIIINVDNTDSNKPIKRTRTFELNNAELEIKVEADELNPGGKKRIIDLNLPEDALILKPITSANNSNAPMMIAFEITAAPVDAVKHIHVSHETLRNMGFHVGDGYIEFNNGPGGKLLVTLGDNKEPSKVNKVNNTIYPVLITDKEGQRQLSTLDKNDGTFMASMTMNAEPADLSQEELQSLMVNQNTNNVKVKKQFTYVQTMKDLGLYDELLKALDNKDDNAIRKIDSLIVIKESSDPDHLFIINEETDEYKEWKENLSEFIHTTMANTKVSNVGEVDTCVFHDIINHIQSLPKYTKQYESQMIFHVKTDSTGTNSTYDVNAFHNIEESLVDNVSDILVDFNIDMDEFLRINTLIPIAISFDPEETEDYDYILWFDPSEDFLKALPDHISDKLRNEFSALSCSEDICEGKAIAGKDAHLDVWRACGMNVENLTVFPNPARDKFSLRYELNEVTDITISLHDMLGNELKTLANYKGQNPGYQQYEFSLSNVEAGMYLIVVQTANGDQAVQRLIIQR